MFKCRALLMSVANLVARKMDPKTFIRYASTSKDILRYYEPNIKRIGTLKRLVRRRQAIKKHANSPLYENRMEAIARSKRSPSYTARSKLRRLKQSASRAFLNYQQNGTNAAWNRFVRIHIKAGGRPNINRVAARRMYD